MAWCPARRSIGSAREGRQAPKAQELPLGWLLMHMLTGVGGVWVVCGQPCPGTIARAVRPSHPTNLPATGSGADQHHMGAGRQ